MLGLLPRAFGVWAHISRCPHQVALAIGYKELSAVFRLAAQSSRRWAGRASREVCRWGRPLYRRPTSSLRGWGFILT